MADSAPFRSIELYDEFSTFEMGVNSGLEPELLPKNQLAFSSNATVRDGFIENRPPFSKRHLQIEWPNDDVKEAVEQGLFQGAAYYQPDSGSQSLFAAIAGRLYQFQITGNDVIVTDRTVAGDPNPASAMQAWLWQSENFLIWNDGISLPVFWDGATSRRSYGPTVELGTVTATSPVSPPDIGTIVTVTLSAAYTGPYNTTVLFNGAFYQTVANSSGYDVTLTNITDTPGTVYPEGTQVIIRSDVFGVQATNYPIGNAPGTYAANTLLVVLTLTLPYTGAIGTQIILLGKIWKVESKNGAFVSVRNTQSITIAASDTIPAGTVILKANVVSPNVVVGAVAESTTFTAPNVGDANQATLNLSYGGAANAVVFIGDKQYTIVAVPAPPGGVSLDLINLTDTSAPNYKIPSTIYSVPELPAGRMGAYGLGQNWMSLVDGLSFVCSDISRGPSGTQAYSYRDSVLKTTDLTFRGGNFAIPGAGNFITSMTFTANLDLSLGQGSLQVGTPAFMASVQSPIDFDNPPSNGPILTFSLIGNGPLAQNSTIRVNSDVYFRQVNGFGSLVQARRDFNYPGNTPMGREMVRVLALDDQKLLNYSQGVLHAGFSVLNLDPLSGIVQKKPPVYDGLWTGINTLQIISGVFDGKERCFAFTFNVSLSKIELYELFPSNTDEIYDDGFIPITWTFETPVLFNRDLKPTMQKISLRNGEIAIDRVRGPVSIQAFYRFDKACWEPWHQFTLCADTTGDEQYFPRLGLGEPSSESCDPILNLPARDGYLLQVKFVVRGQCRFTKGKFAAVTLPQEKYAPPRCDETIQVETITTQ